MAQKTIPALDATTSITKDALFPVDSGIQTFKMTALNVAKELARIWPEYSKNYLDNPGFDVWQKAITATTATGGRNYVCDRWYTRNALGTSGVITTTREAGNVSGSIYGLKQIISTAPTASQANGCETFQGLENFDSRFLMGKDASFSVYVRAFGNVNQIGVQFFSKSSADGQLDTAIGSEVTATVSTGADTLVKIEGQALGTAMTASGIIGVRIRITGVSSGNLYDLNNGYQIEQAMLNPGLLVLNFNKPSIDQIIAKCQRTYRTSYPTGIFPGDSSSGSRDNGAVSHIRSGGNSRSSVHFGSSMRIAPSVTIYNPTTGATSSMRDITDNANASATATLISESGFTNASGLGTDGGIGYYHYVADATV